jgi:hypothetical protein
VREQLELLVQDPEFRSSKRSVQIPGLFHSDHSFFFYGYQKTILRHFVNIRQSVPGTFMLVSTGKDGSRLD